MQAWMAMLDSGGWSSMVNCHLRIPNIHSIAFWAEECQRLYNSSQLAGLWDCVRSISKLCLCGLPDWCMTPLCKMISGTLKWNKEPITCTKTGICKVELVLGDHQVRLASIIVHSSICHWTIPPTEHILKSQIKAAGLLRFNSVGVEIRGLRPEVVAKGDEVSVHYRSRTNMRRRLSTEILAQVDRRTREHL